METEELIRTIIDAGYRVHMALLPGYLESVYKNALMHELSLRNLVTESEVPLKVYYKGTEVGNFIADLIVERRVIIELKAVSKLSLQHEIQLVNYLNCTGIDVGLLINFGSDKLQVKRKFRLNNKET